ncbi:TPA: hypothetical protein ACOEP7_001520 [Enterobacter asburiae]
MRDVGTIRNPLTIIAVFAGLVEVSATAVLPFLHDVMLQSRFVWFLIFFPIMLVILFFSVLVLKPEKLYAPKDFRDDKSFLDIHAKQKVELSGAKIEHSKPVKIEIGAKNRWN